MKAPKGGTFTQASSSPESEESWDAPSIPGPLLEYTRSHQYEKWPGFKDIGGLPDEISGAFEHWKEILTHPDNYASDKIRSMLLYGKPGLGKTMFLQALVKECAKNVVFASPRDYKTKLTRAKSPEERLQIIHDELATLSARVAYEDSIPPRNGRPNSRRTVFFLCNEVDYYFPKGVTFATDIWDSLEEEGHTNIAFMATTNYIQKVNPAIRSRFGLANMHEIHMPDPDQRTVIIARFLYLIQQEARNQGRGDQILDGNFVGPLAGYIKADKEYREYIGRNPNAAAEEPQMHQLLLQQSALALANLRDALGTIIGAANGLSQRDIRDIMGSLAERHHVKLNINERREEAGLSTGTVLPITAEELASVMRKGSLQLSDIESLDEDDDEITGRRYGG